jgi:hypothetical protein
VSQPKTLIERFYDQAIGMLRGKTTPVTQIEDDLYSMNCMERGDIRDLCHAATLRAQKDYEAAQKSEVDDTTVTVPETSRTEPAGPSNVISFDLLDPAPVPKQADKFDASLLFDSAEPEQSSKPVTIAEATTVEQPDKNGEFSSPLAGSLFMASRGVNAGAKIDRVTP